MMATLVFNKLIKLIFHVPEKKTVSGLATAKVHHWNIKVLENCICGLKLHLNFTFIWKMVCRLHYKEHELIFLNLLGKRQPRNLFILTNEQVTISS